MENNSYYKTLKNPSLSKATEENIQLKKTKSFPITNHRK